jgi:hypothetical protein
VGYIGGEFSAGACAEKCGKITILALTENVLIFRFKIYSSREISGFRKR